MSTKTFVVGIFAMCIADLPLGAMFEGWRNGIDVDYACTNNIFARAEYRVKSYGDKEVLGIKADLDQHVVGVGIGVKF